MSTCSESCTAEYNSARRSAMFGCNQARKRFHPYPDCDFMMTSMSDAVTDRFYDGNWHDSFIAGQRSTRPSAVNLRRDTHPKHHDKEARTQSGAHWAVAQQQQQCLLFVGRGGRRGGLDHFLWSCANLRFRGRRCRLGRLRGAGVLHLAVASHAVCHWCQCN